MKDWQKERSPIVFSSIISNRDSLSSLYRDSKLLLNDSRSLWWQERERLEGRLTARLEVRRKKETKRLEKSTEIVIEKKVIGAD